MLRVGFTRDDYLLAAEALSEAASGGGLPRGGGRRRLGTPTGLSWQPRPSGCRSSPRGRESGRADARTAMSPACTGTGIQFSMSGVQPSLFS